jgi:hypothetical protein
MFERTPATHSRYTNPFFRLYLLSQEYVDLSTDTLTAIAMSMGGGPVFVLQLVHAARPAEREEARGAILTLAQKDLTRLGFSAMQRLEPGGSSGSVAPPTAAQNRAVVLLGMDITLAGGEEACSEMTSIAEIQQAGTDVRRAVCTQPPCVRVCVPECIGATAQVKDTAAQNARLPDYVDHIDYAL